MCEYRLRDGRLCKCCWVHVYEQCIRPALFDELHLQTLHLDLQLCLIDG